MYVLGGRSEGVRTTGNVLKFDSIQDIWTEVAPMPASRYDFAACSIGSELYVFGGRNSQGAGQASAFSYDTVTNVWSPIPPMPRVAHRHSASPCNGLIYIVGIRGIRSHGLHFDPILGIWGEYANSLYSRWRGTSFVLDGCLYAGWGSVSSSNVERYNESTNTWKAVADMLEERCYFCSVSIESFTFAEDFNLFDSLINTEGNPWGQSSLIK
jgi:hypothetical protein